MGWKRGLAAWLVQKNLAHLLPWRLIKVYLYPRLLRGEKLPYCSGQFFESYYRSLAPREFSDRITIAPDIQPLHSRFHYNATENSIIRCLVRHPVKSAPVVLDVGSGAGHWIDFWLTTLSASYVHGIDISKTCALALGRKYANLSTVRITQDDISSADFAPSRCFDIISAIGVLFHIVDDDRWQQALVNMRRFLNENGIIIVGGYFGWITQNTQFHLTDDFSNEDQAINSLQNFHGVARIYYNKRVRSLRRWKVAAAASGLRIVQLVRTPTDARIGTPENNILALMRTNHTHARTS